MSSIPNHADLLAAFENPRLLKRGGQKVAYRANSSEFGEVAVKIGGYVNPTSLQRARREVETLRLLNSQFYPRQYAFQEAPGNRFMVVEEFIPSTPLAECLGRFRSSQEVLWFIRHLVAGLRLLWDQRIVHRDVKPDNILVRPNGRPVIIDLGIARLLDAESLTVSHAARGPCTPVYAAPEQLQNRKTAIDVRTDQFALGIILVQLLLDGRHPFDPHVVGAGEGIVANILDARWHWPISEPAIPPGTFELAKRLLGREPHQRYRSIDKLDADLCQLLEGAGS